MFSLVFNPRDLYYKGYKNDDDNKCIWIVLVCRLTS